MSVRRKRLGVALLVFSAAVFLGTSALTSSPVTASGPSALCSASDSNSSTGRQYAMLSPSPGNVGYCVRKLLGGEAPPDVPNCWDAAATAGFDCSIKIVTI